MSIKAKDMTMAERKEHVAQLVNQFKENKAFYLSKNFVESEVRNKFIDPLAWMSEMGCLTSAANIAHPKLNVEFYLRKTSQN